MKLAIASLVLALAAAPPARAQTDRPPQSPPQPSTRAGVALVIDNSKYGQAAELPSVELDGKRMAAALKSLGFEVRQLENVARPKDFEDQLDAFFKAVDMGTDDTLVVYYSGHGLQINSSAYILGTGVPSTADAGASLLQYSEDLDVLIRKMEDSGAAARVLIVDACRNNAFASNYKKAGPAFRADMEDTYLLFADEPGKTVPARTDSTDQSPFTAGLLFAFENSDGGIEERFQIAKDKTQQLNPDQIPVLQKSSTSPNRHRPFLDHGGKATPLALAADLLDEAEIFYQSASWDLFRDKIRAARVLSTDEMLTKRLTDELKFSDFVAAAQRAENDKAGPQWPAAAQAWQSAGELFPARLWTLERAAIDRLQADDLRGAAALLGRLTAYHDTPQAQRASTILSSLVKTAPSLGPVAESAAKAAPPVTGPEFQKYSGK